MGIMPAAGHMVHMRGHMWLVLGDWEMAASVNHRAAEVDRQYFAATNVTTSFYTAYYAHNLSFIADAPWMRGRKAHGRARPRRWRKLGLAWLESCRKWRKPL